MRNVVLYVKRYMQFYLRITLTLLCFVFLISFYNYTPPSVWKNEKGKSEELPTPEQNDKFEIVSKRETNDFRLSVDFIHLAVVSCGERLEEPLMMLKSAVIFGSNPLYFHIFADDNLRVKFNESLTRWKEVVTWKIINFTIYPIQFPEQHADEWRRLFKLCACQRLFIPKLLQNVDSLLYVDTDVLFLRPVESLWEHFKHFNSSHIAASAPETEDASTNWYVRFARHPYYKPLGINSGVMLMNLTRMRQFGWEQYLYPTLNKYRYNITWGDQDIINIIFSQHPDKLYVYGCEWNYRPDHCMYMSTCKTAERDGVSVLHGSRGYFHLDKQPAFKAVYDVFKSYKLGFDLNEYLLRPLTVKLEETRETNCGKVYPVFLKHLQSIFS